MWTRTVNGEWIFFEIEYTSQGLPIVKQPKKTLIMTTCIFEPRTDTSSATICKHCGQEKYLHTT